MENIFSFILENFVLLFIIIDPIMVAPVFLVLTKNMSAQSKASIAKRAFWASTILMLLFAFIGKALLKFLGIDTAALQISGGIILIIMGIRMIMFDETDAVKESASHDVAIFPLAVPLLAGPGAFTSIIMQMDRARHWFWGQMGIIFVIILNMVIALILMQCSKYIVKFIGSKGAEVCNRLLGLILTALAVQFILDGMKIYVQSL